MENCLRRGAAANRTLSTRDFDYDLPPASIASRPRPRGTSRLLVLNAAGAARHRTVADLPQLLQAGDLLVVNDTRVLSARLRARRLHHGVLGGVPGGALEMLLVEPIAATDWLVMLRPGRRARGGVALCVLAHDGSPALHCTVLGRSTEHAGLFRVRFDRAIEELLEELGEMPLPPYIRRPADQRDRVDYQTVFAREPGAVAAPTAGLHFNQDLLTRLESAGIRTASITLHVGPGTFRPVDCDDPAEHTMDSERFHVPEATVRAIRETRAGGGKVIAVGTTTVRALESAATTADCALTAGSGRSELFIRPPYVFRVVDQLLTNFHLPRSTLLMLVSALGGRERVLAAYREAIGLGYAFYSYGDAMLVAPPASTSTPR